MQEYRSNLLKFYIVNDFVMNSFTRFIAIDIDIFYNNYLYKNVQQLILIGIANDTCNNLATDFFYFCFCLCSESLLPKITHQVGTREEIFEIVELNRKQINFAHISTFFN